MSIFRTNINSREDVKVNHAEQYGKWSLLGYQTGNWEKSIIEMQKLEDDGFGEAGVAIGQLMQAKNEPEALVHFLQASDCGIAEGSWGVSGIIGHNYIVDVEKEDKNWYHYCMKAAKGGCPDAMHELGNIYMHINDYLSAFYWFLMSGYYEHPDGFYDANYMVNKWNFYRRPNIDVEKKAPEVQKAYPIWQIYTGEKSMDRQMSDALYVGAMAGSEIQALFMAHFYEDHTPLLNNAKLFFQIAAQQGSIMGMKCLGDMLAYGKGCEQDMSKAFSWYLNAANAGEKTAAYIMGQFTKEHVNLSAYWFSVSHRRGYQPAFEEMRKLGK